MKAHHSKIKIAIFLAAACFQASQLSKGNVKLPKGYRLVATIIGEAGIIRPKSEVFGYIAESRHSIIIAFRGTETGRDGFSDLDITQIPFPYVANGGKTHQGFTRIYGGDRCLLYSARDQIIKKLWRLDNRKTLFITGHSLGGALATLCALDVAINTKFKQPRVYTFGSPKVGDPAFVEIFNQTIRHSVRVYNCYDVVPEHPKKRYALPILKNCPHYEHVKGEFPISFELCNKIKNHTTRNYFFALSTYNLFFSEKLCKKNAGFCPSIKNYHDFRRINKVACMASPFEQEENAVNE
ncbi:lipase family protein [Fictibacillus gelatini]|uniref:lipase family protein n=1 Tax=Fictibacillus gelatini TaxID=225985 RepID=UPI0004122E9D|nr:lipase family protein [Fictibacillus gelatini]